MVIPISSRVQLHSGVYLFLFCPQKLSLLEKLRSSPEEVRHGDVTAGVERVWNVITTDK